MVRITQAKSNLYTRQILEQALSSKQLSTPEHLQITTALLSDSHLTEAERQQINHIFDQIQSKNIRIID